jgi:ribonuclease BN (tRNA processing enzyme)
VGKLLLTHISARYREPDLLLEQASAEFANCIVASDSMRIDV